MGAEIRPGGGDDPMAAPPAETEVLVVGGGPTGLAAAVELGTRDVDCVVLEPRTSVSHSRPRAKTTNVRTMEHFRRLGIAERIREAAYLPVDWSQEAVFTTTLTGEQITRFDGILGLEPGRRDTFAESAQQIPQFLVEEVLRETVESAPSVDPAWGWRLDTLTQSEGGVSATVSHDGATKRQEVTAEYLLGCDGAGSTVRDEIGASFEGEGSPRSNLGIVIRAPGLAERHPHGDAVHYWLVNNDQPGLMGRLDLDERWWLIAVGVDDPDAADPAATVQAMVGEPFDFELVATDPWRSKMLIADTYREGRVFLAGDAVSLNPPWGGLGFNTGVADAVDLGWKLAAVLRGWGGPSLLDSYAAERRPVHERVIEKTAENMQTSPADLAAEYVDDPDALDEGARRRAAERIRAVKSVEFYSLGLVLGYRYDGSPVIDGGERASRPDSMEYQPSFEPGVRLPHAWLGTDRSVYDELGPAFSLVLTMPDLDPAPFQTAAADREVPLEVVDLSSVEVYTELDAPGAVLVRPDQHVAWSGTTLPDSPASLLDRVTGQA